MTHEPQDQRDVRATSGTGFTVALFMRDRLALPVADDVPALTPRIEVEPLPADEAAALADEWRQWWDLLTTAPTGYVDHPRSEPLAVAFDAVVDEARAWAEENVRPNLFLAQDDLGPGLDASSPDMRLPGDPAVPMVLDIEYLPVAGQWHKDLGPDRLLVSIETWEDLTEMATLLAPRIERLQSQERATPRPDPQVWHLEVDGQVFTVKDRPREPGTYDFFWENGPIQGYGFTIGTSRGTPLTEDVLRHEIRGFVEGYEG